jgi:hypothetical protein
MTATALLPAVDPQPGSGDAPRRTVPLRLVPTGPAVRPPVPLSPGGVHLLDDSPTASELAAARRAARRRLPAPAGVMRAVALALLEVEAGYRSAEQLERRCTPDAWSKVNARLRRRGGAFVTGGSLVRVVCQENSPGLADGVVVVRRDGRVSAVAIRLDARDGRWTVTELFF